MLCTWSSHEAGLADSPLHTGVMRCARPGRCTWLLSRTPCARGRASAGRASDDRSRQELSATRHESASSALQWELPDACVSAERQVAGWPFRTACGRYGQLAFATRRAERQVSGIQSGPADVRYGWELPFAADLPERQVSGAEFGTVDVSSGSIAGLAVCRKRSFDGGVGRWPLQTPSTAAPKPGFRRSGCANDCSPTEPTSHGTCVPRSLRPRKTPNRTFRAKTVATAKQRLPTWMSEPSTAGFWRRAVMHDALLGRRLRRAPTRGRIARGLRR